MWLYSAGFDGTAFGRDWRRLVEDLAEAGIQARPIWSPLHTMPMYRERARLGGSVAEAVFAAGLSLPCSVGLTDAQQDAVVRALRGR
jgi:dTDP-4-amino-4,6-dideoxygalactose transaminase